MIEETVMDKFFAITNHQFINLVIEVTFALT